MKNLLIFFLLLCFSNQAAAQFSGDGSGTQSDPYKISSPIHLNEIRNNLSAYYILTANIDLGGATSSSPFWNNGKGWQPIGTSDSPFTGRLAGEGHAIKNLYINRQDEKYNGLFGYIGMYDVEADSTIRVHNLRLENAEVTAGDWTGILSGLMVRSAADSIYANGVVNGKRFTGGIIGENVFSGYLTHSGMVGTVHGTQYTGGLVGVNSNLILKSYANVDIIGTTEVGGIAGMNGHTIRYCYVTGSASGEDRVGGLIGFDAFSIKEYSYASVAISGSGETGGLFGYYTKAGNRTFWNTEVSGQDSAAGNWSAAILGLTTEEMRQQASYFAWDFEKVWAIDENRSFAYLQSNQQSPLPGFDSTVVASEAEPELPQSIQLFQNYPNPFNPSTVISYKLPVNTHVRLEVFDMLGRKIATLVDGKRKTAGTYQVTFDAQGLASGIYIYQLQTGNTVITRKLTLIK